MLTRYVYGVKLQVNIIGVLIYSLELLSSNLIILKIKIPLYFNPLTSQP
jgi:hypothetical protein